MKSSSSQRKRASQGTKRTLYAQIPEETPQPYTEESYTQSSKRFKIIFWSIVSCILLTWGGFFITNATKEAEPNLLSGNTEDSGNSAAELSATSIGNPDSAMDTLANNTNIDTNQNSAPLTAPTQQRRKQLPENWDTITVGSQENLDDVALRAKVARRWLERANKELNWFPDGQIAVKTGMALAIPSEQAIENWRVSERLAQTNQNSLTPPISTSENTNNEETLVAIQPVPPPSSTETITTTPIEPRSASTAEQTTSRTHIVVTGETFYRIAMHYQVDFKELMALNGYTDAGKLQVGAILKIP